MDADDFRCPICLNLLYKPAVVSACGHAFCFYCLFRSMSPYDEATCPLCRKHFAHLPAVCLALHQILRTAFPETYAKREEEEEAEVRSLGYKLPAADDSGCSSQNEDGSCMTTPSSSENADTSCPAALRCSDPGCGAALAEPTVLNCGHSLCCAHRPLDNEEAGEGDTASYTTISAWVCPQCGETTSLPVATCSVLDLAVLQTAPDAHAKALAQRGIRPINQTTRYVVSLGERPERVAESPLSSSPEPRSPVNELEGRATRFVANFAPDSYVHYGVGCDACGMHPIVGRRWKCADCQDSIGFDLCQSCKDRLSTHQIRGRFSQGHMPDHRLVEVTATITTLHLLRALNPDLSAAQLLSLVALSTEPDDEEELVAPLASHEEEQEEGSRSAPLNGEGGERQSQTRRDSVPIPWLRRGPRPAIDLSAEWPSPSAPSRSDDSPQGPENGSEHTVVLGDAAAASSGEGYGEEGNMQE